MVGEDVAGLVAEHGPQLELVEHVIGRELSSTIGCCEPIALALMNGFCAR